MKDPLEDMTPEQHERLRQAEQYALQMMTRKMSEGRWYPRRHMQVAVVALVALVVFAGLMLLVANLFS